MASLAPDIPTPGDWAALAPQGSLEPPAGKRTLIVNTPYGRKTVYIPIGLSPDEAMLAVRQHLLPKLEGEHTAQLEASTKENAPKADTQIFIPGMGMMTIPGKYVIAAGHGFDQLVQGTKQLLGLGSDEQDKAQAAANQQMQRFYSVFPEAKVGTAIGEGLPIAAVSAAVTPAAALATPIRQIVNAAVQSGAASAVPYVPPGGSRVANIAEGAKTGAMLQLPFSAAYKTAIGPARTLSGPQAGAVEDMLSIPGVSPLPSQLTGNPSLANVEKVAAYFPFSGGQIAARNAANREAVSARGLKIMGAPEGSTLGTPDILKAIEDKATGVFKAVRESGIPVRLNDDQASSLAAIRDAALATNSPNAKLVGTLNKLIGDSSSELRPEIASLGEGAQEQMIAKLGKDAFMPPAKDSRLYPQGMPQDFFQSVQSDLSDLSAKGQHYAGKANSVLTQAAVDSLPPELGAAYLDARQQYSALRTAQSAFDPATGILDPRKLTTNLSASGGGPDVVRFLESSNPKLVDLAETANAARGMPPVPAAGSDTAQKLAWQKWLGTLGEVGAAAGAGLAGHVVSGGDLAATGAAGVLPFLFANYGTKAYLSPAFAKYVQEGLPTLKEIMESGAMAGSAIPGLSAYSTSP